MPCKEITNEELSIKLSRLSPKDRKFFEEKLLELLELEGVSRKKIDNDFHDFLIGLRAAPNHSANE